MSDDRIEFDREFPRFGDRAIVGSYDEYCLGEAMKFAELASVDDFDVLLDAYYEMDHESSLSEARRSMASADIDRVPDIVDTCDEHYEEQLSREERKYNKYTTEPDEVLRQLKKEERMTFLLMDNPDEDYLEVIQEKLMKPRRSLRRFHL